MASQPDNGLSDRPIDTRKVFVVYGRNEQIREAMFDFLRAISLEPIEWSKAVAMTGKPAPYVGEVLDVALRQAQAIVVVMTPDDEANLRVPYQKDDDPPYEKVPTPQPRPNVLFEAGFAMGHAPGRTVLVQIGNVRPFSDIQGVHVVRLNNTDEKKKDLAQRLKSAGCSVDLTGDDWLKKRDFEIHEKPDSTPAESSEKDDPAASAPNAQRELVQTEVDILTAMAKGGDKGYTASQVAKMLGIDEQRAKYYLNKLRDSKHVDIRFYRDFGNVASYYHIGEVGNAYLVEHNLV